MKSYKTENITLIKENHPLLLSRLNDTNSDDLTIETIYTKNGDPIPLYNVNEKKLYIHSRFDPFREAERFISEINPEAHDLYIFFGFGFGYHIEKFLKLMSKNATLLVIEKNSEIVKEAIDKRNLHDIFEDERLLFLIDPDENRIAETIKGRSSKKTTFITHRGSFQIYPDYYSNLTGLCRSFLSTKDVNIATLAKFEKLWGANIARNINKLIENPGANIFFEKLKNYPAIVVAAGPSLQRSIPYIKKYSNDAVIIAVDTAYSILKKQGITPHFCISVDPQIINARYFEGQESGKTILVSDSSVHPSIYRFFDGKTVLTGLAFDLMKWIETITGDKGRLTHGGSVSTNAYDFALRTGASPIIMVGQDLSFTNGHAHCPGSYLDEQLHLATNRFKTIELFNRNQLTALPKIFIKGIDDNDVHTNQKMMIFLSWFEKHNNNHLINATPEGAFIPGVVHKNFEDIKIESCKKNIFNEINSIYQDGLNSLAESSHSKERLLKKIEQMTLEIDSLFPVLEKAIGFSENLLKLMSDKSNDKGKIEYTLNKLSQADSVIESKKNVKDIISFAIQRVIHTINEGYEIDENDGSMENDELVAKKSLYLYRGFLEGTGFVRKVLYKMKYFLTR